MPKHCRKKKKKDVLLTGGEKVPCRCLAHLFLLPYTALGYGLNVCIPHPHPHNSYVEIFTPKVTVFGGDRLGGGLGTESGALMMGLASLSKRLQRTPLPPLSFEDTVRRCQSVIPEEDSPDTKSASTLRASSLQNWRKQTRVV